MDNKNQREWNVEDLKALYERPGFLIRRAHQITVSLFMEEASVLGATTTQYGVMTILRSRSGVDQIGLAKMVGLDRSTTALVVTKLEADGYLERRIDPADRRRRELVLTPAGLEMLQRLEGPAHRAQERALSVFSEHEATQFVKLLDKFVQAFNDVTRAPIAAADADGSQRWGRARKSAR